ncbi:hypothetical protein JOM56_013532 [Amanita muscaria]
MLYTISSLSVPVLVLQYKNDKIDGPRASLPHTIVLSANEQNEGSDIPHLVMRVSIAPEASVSAGWEGGDGPGRLVNTAVDPKPVGDTMGMEINMDIRASTQAGVVVGGGGFKSDAMPRCGECSRFWTTRTGRDAANKALKRTLFPPPAGLIGDAA